jgi:nicotinamidase-related amidase
MRHPDLATRQDLAIVAIDFQEKLVNMLHNREAVLAGAIRIIEFARAFQIPVVLTEHYPQGLGSTVPEVEGVLASYEPVIKRVFSSFGVPAFEEALKAAGARQLVVCGIETHICVNQTVHDALAHGYKVHLVSDACGTRFENDHRVGLEKMRASGAVIATSEMVMYEIVERADTDDFKTLLKLVK